MAAAQKAPSMVPHTQQGRSSGRSALGVGVTTLVTIMVVLLLAAFAVLSLVSARSDLKLSQTAAASAEHYYAADAEATRWYATLDAFAASLSASNDEAVAALTTAGYTAAVNDKGQLWVTTSFTINDYRKLMVTVQVNEDRTTIIRQWQS